MPKFFAGQKKLRIRLSTGQDLSAGGIAAVIKYRKPDGTTGQWTATIESPETAGYIYFDCTATDGEFVAASEFGVWAFWAYITFPTALPAPGEAAYEKFYEEPS
jgi:hypothetical protein